VKSRNAIRTIFPFISRNASFNPLSDPAIGTADWDLGRGVTAGIQNARKNGKKLGRPKSGVDLDRILELKAQGHSLRQIAATLRVGYGTVRARLLTSHRI
jgi:hypothetical protein